MAVMPSAASASLRPVSSVAIDLTLTTWSAPAARDQPGYDRVGLDGVLAAQCTWPPAWVTLSSSRSRYVSRWASVWSLIALAADLQLLPVAELGDGPGPLGADHPGRVGQVVAELGVGESGGRGLGEGRHAQVGWHAHRLTAPAWPRGTAG